MRQAGPAACWQAGIAAVEHSLAQPHEVALAAVALLLFRMLVLVKPAFSIFSKSPGWQLSRSIMVSMYFQWLTVSRRHKRPGLLLLPSLAMVGHVTNQKSRKPDKQA